MYIAAKLENMLFIKYNSIILPIWVPIICFKQIRCKRKTLISVSSPAEVQTPDKLLQSTLQNQDQSYRSIPFLMELPKIQKKYS